MTQDELLEALRSAPKESPTAIETVVVIAIVDVAVSSAPKESPTEGWT